MKKTLLCIMLGATAHFLFAQTPPAPTLPPDRIYGQLFHDVQMAKVFPDGKTFVDCVPKRSPKDIVTDYAIQKPTQGFDLKKFVDSNFELPRTPQLNYITKETDVVMHIKNLWGVLRREADKPIEGSSLIPLPNSYIVPGGRFREVYYWDSYFTMLGLKESGETEMIENMVKNFAWLIETYGHIPNGNRTYYLSRSQPPFFALMVELLAGIKGDSIYSYFLPALEKEYNFWMDGAAKLKTGQAFRRVVKMSDGTIMNRYWDDNPAPRQESYKEDVETAEQVVKNFLMVATFRDAVQQKKATDDLRAKTYTNLRAGAESGIDFSTRWFKDRKTLTTIQVIDYVPVDLNALLYRLETIIAKGRSINHDEIRANELRKMAETRRKAIDKYCWNKTLKYYTDYNFRTKTISQLVNPGGMYPFCVFQTRLDYMSLLARQAAEQIKAKLLQPGGIQTTPINSGQQWDAPNGWPPLEWMTIWGLDRCGQRELARDIGQRWIKLNVDVFKRTGKLMEKYNVADTQLEAGGGEYPSQDGFGWTNGVLLALIKKYGMPQ